jgi:ubiquinone/menaquinone biosynthesis C-methylase UbiE
MPKNFFVVAAILCFFAVAFAAFGQERDEAERREQIEFDQIVQLLRVADGTVVADVGAGGGQWSFRLATRVGAKGRVFATEVKGPQVEGIQTVARARNLNNLSVIYGSQQEIGLPADCCDAMLLRLVYHAFREPERMRDSMQRAMKVGGLVLIVDFRPLPDQLTQEMQQAGFERVHVVERWQNRTDLYALLFRKSAGR